MKGHKDGSYSECQFVSPQGACKVGDALYVVDSVTHHLRKVSTDYHYNQGVLKLLAITHPLIAAYTVITVRSSDVIPQVLS